MKNSVFLIVDDSESVRSGIRKVLVNMLGAQNILMAGNGKEALRVLRDRKVDCIISDWDMPEMNGEEFLYHVRNSPGLADIPFIMVSEHGESDFIMTAVQLGVTNYLMKPVPAVNLANAVIQSWNVLNKRRANRYFSIPDHTLSIGIGGKEYPASIVNISRTGILLTMEFVDGMSLFGGYALSMEVNNGPGLPPWTIPDLAGSVVRIEAVDVMNPASRKCNAGLCFRPNALNRVTEAALQQFLGWLSRQNPEVIGEQA